MEVVVLAYVLGVASGSFGERVTRIIARFIRRQR